MDGNSPSGFTDSTYGTTRSFPKDNLEEDIPEPGNMIEVFEMSEDIKQFIDYIYEKPWILIIWF